MSGMKLDEVVANATRRSPTPETLGSQYRDTAAAFPGSGVLTPDVPPQISGANNRPHLLEMSGLPVALPGHSQSIETRFRLNGVSADRNRTIHDAVGIGSEGMGIPGPNTYHFRPDVIHPPFGSHPTGLSPPPMASLNPLSAMVGGPHPPHYISNPSPFASPQPPSVPAPSALTTTFPSNFPYNNLSPSHFTAGSPPGHLGVLNGVGVSPTTGSSYIHTHPPPPRAWGPP